jgi:DNA-binding SARP family transcriptional activator
VKDPQGEIPIWGKVKVTHSRFEFELLGPVRAWRDGARLQAGSPQQQAVLAVLLLARGGHVSVGSMIDSLWGDRPPKAAVGAVRTYVSRLRQTLGTAEHDANITLESAGDGYLLRGDHVVVDLDIFEARVRDGVAAWRDGSPHAADLCRDALALWRGTPLAGVPGPRFEPIRARLVEMRVDAAEIELAAQVASGDHLAAIAGLRALVTEQPLRESLHELLMLALFRAGRQAAALEVYATARGILHDELGIEPGASLRRMQERVLAGDDRPSPDMNRRVMRGRTLLPRRVGAIRMPLDAPQLAVTSTTKLGSALD